MYRNYYGAPRDPYHPNSPWLNHPAYPLRDRYSPEDSRPRRDHAPRRPTPGQSPGPITQLNPRRLDEKNPKDDSFPVSRSRLNKWRDEVDKVEQMCRIVQSLEISSRDKKTLQECLVRIRSTTRLLKDELKERTKREKLERLDLVRI